MTLEEALAELPAGERATNTTVTYCFELDGGQSEDEVRAEVRRRFPAFRRVEANHCMASLSVTGKILKPPTWRVHVTLRKEW